MANPYSNACLSLVVLSEFEFQLRRLVGLADIVNAERSGYLQLHLPAEALNYF